MVAQIENGDRILSEELFDHVFRAWCEANATMRGRTVDLAVARIKALEALWSAWKALRTSRSGYHRSMPEAVKALDRSDKGGAELETKPSELFKRQIWATFQEDYAAMSLIPFFGEGHLLWASDYPHPDGVWPNSRAAIERQMAGLSVELRRKLTHDNAARLYGLI